MDKKTGKILIMAAGTGGHVFPALSIARQMQRQGVEVEWLGTPAGMENELLRDTSIKLYQVSVKGLRGSNIKRKLMAPLMLIQALQQSITIIRQSNPDCVLGMGGFVCGPAGIAAKLLRVPLLIHEQNAVPGLTNKWLSRVANLVIEAFPGTFPASQKVLHLGNPVREDIAELHGRTSAAMDRYRPLRILVLGGSQGAEAINKVIPELLVNWDGIRPEVIHQAGARNHDKAVQLYKSLDITLDKSCQVVPFVNDMAEVFAWADVVIARSGASTVSEIAAVGLPAIFIPYPYHKDQQQLLNARWLVEKNAAYLLEQKELSAKSVLKILHQLDRHRDTLDVMRNNASQAAILDSSEKIAAQCRRFMHA